MPKKGVTPPALKKFAFAKGGGRVGTKATTKTVKTSPKKSSRGK